MDVHVRVYADLTTASWTPYYSQFSKNLSSPVDFTFCKRYVLIWSWGIGLVV